MASKIDPKMLKVLSAIKHGENEQVLIERALGRAMIEKMSGKECSLKDCYNKLGGKDPGVVAMVSGELDDVFQKLPVNPGIEIAQKRTLSADIVSAAAKKNAVLDSNVLTIHEGQALKTLADIGGEDFAKRYKLDKF